MYVKFNGMRTIFQKTVYLLLISFFCFFAGFGQKVVERYCVEGNNDSSKTVFVYDSSDNLISEHQLKRNGDSTSWVNTQRISYYYDSLGRLYEYIREIFRESENRFVFDWKRSITYTIDGKINERKYYVPLYPNPGWFNHQVDSFTYNAVGQLIQMQIRSPSGPNLTWERNPPKYYFYDSLGRLINDGYYQYFYDSLGLLSIQIVNNSIDSFFYFYDSLRRVIKLATRGLSYYDSTVYDNKGRISKEIRMQYRNGSWEIGRICWYVYDVVTNLDSRFRGNDKRGGNDGLSIYPNPFTQSFTINFQQKDEIASQARNDILYLSLYNSLGQRVIEQSVVGQAGENEFTMETVGVGKGIYSLEVVSNEGVRRVKVVRE